MKTKVIEQEEVTVSIHGETRMELFNENVENVLASGQGSGGSGMKVGNESLVQVEEVKEELEIMPQLKGWKKMEMNTTRGSSSKGTMKKISPVVCSQGNLRRGRHQWRFSPSQG